VAGSRRRQRAETAESTTVPEDHDTGAEAWSEDAVHADDLVTETEAGPLEESDFDGDAEGLDAEGDDGAEATDGSEATGEAEETDTTDETDADDGADGGGADDETDGGSAGEKDK
jgi:hypothetical protein